VGCYVSTSKRHSSERVSSRYCNVLTKCNTHNALKNSSKLPVIHPIRSETGLNEQFLHVSGGQIQLRLTSIHDRKLQISDICVLCWINYSLSLCPKTMCFINLGASEAAGRNRTWGTSATGILQTPRCIISINNLITQRNKRR
jgi:hypothetical protein